MKSSFSLSGATPRQVRGHGRDGPRVARSGSLERRTAPRAAGRTPWACAEPRSTPRHPASISAQTLYDRDPPRRTPSLPPPWPPPWPPPLNTPWRPLWPGSTGRRFPPGSRMGPDWNPACPAGGREGEWARRSQGIKAERAQQPQEASLAHQLLSHTPWGSNKPPNLTSPGRCCRCCSGQGASFPTRPSWRHTARKCLAPRQPWASERTEGKCSPGCIPGQLERWKLSPSRLQCPQCTTYWKAPPPRSCLENVVLTLGGVREPSWAETYSAFLFRN